MVETFVLQTMCTKELKMEDIPITQHHLDHQIEIVSNEAFSIEGHPVQVIGFTIVIYMGTPIMSFIPST